MNANHKERLPVQPLVYNYIYRYLYVYQESQTCVTILVLRLVSQRGEGWHKSIVQTGEHLYNRSSPEI